MNIKNQFSNTADLIKKIETGDQNAIHALIEKYQEKIHMMARMRLGKELRTKMESMDIVQDAILKALKSLENARARGNPLRFDSEKEFLAWLYKIVKTRILDVARHYGASKNRLSKEIPIGDTAGYINAKRATMQKGNPAEILDNMILLDSLLSALSEEEKKILKLKHVYEYTFEEIAKVVNKSSDACRMKYNRIIKRLSKLVNESLEQ